MAFPTWGVGGGSWELRGHGGGGGGGGSNGVVEGRGFQRGGRFRLAKRGSFSSTGVLLARNDDNGMKKLILIEPAGSSGPTPIQYHFGPIGRIRLKS